MRTYLFRPVTLILLIASLGLLACDVTTLVSGGGGKPTVSIQAPANGSVFREGEDVAVQSTSKDSAGIVRVELSIDGAAVHSDTPPVPQGQVSFTLLQTWKATPGTHTLSVRAFNASGAASDPALVSITVAPASTAGSTPAPTSQAFVPGTESGITPLPTLSPTAEGPIFTPTRRPPTPVPPTPTISAPPGVYAVSIRSDPAQPKRGSPPTFYVTFLNTTGKLAQYRWFIKIYEPDKPNSKGETSKAANDFPAGRVELPAPADWAIRGAGPCEPFIARVFWFDRESNQTTEFSKPDLSGGPALGFEVCP